MPYAIRSSLFALFCTFIAPSAFADADPPDVRKGPYKYIRWIRFQDRAELYDLHADPYELRNRVHDPDMTEVVDDLQSELRRWVVESAGLD